MPEPLDRDATLAVCAGRRPHENHGAVNPPVVRASTILFPTLQALRASRHVRRGDAVTYGVHGTPTAYAFEEAVAALEGGYRTRVAPSGMAAVSIALQAYLGAGDHLLVPDGAYPPTRMLCDGMLRRQGVETTYYDPLVGAGIAALIRPETRVIFLESPGSWTFEVQDVPAIAAAARAAGAVTIMDNTWASPLYFKPFAHGVDVSVQAATKYIAGHSDVMLGTITATEAAYPPLQQAILEFGLCASPDDVYLAMRGLRTLHARLPHHERSGLAVAAWLRDREEVAEVIHPGLPGSRGHELWKRDFLGAAGLFAFVLRPELSDERRLAAMLDGMRLFGMGYSWGGFESLILPLDPPSSRTATTWPPPGVAAGQLMRASIGLESVDDLIADLARGFARLRE